VVDVEVALDHRVDVVGLEAGSREVVVEPMVRGRGRIERLTEVVRPVTRRGRVVDPRVPEYRRRRVLDDERVNREGPVCSPCVARVCPSGNEFSSHRSSPRSMTWTVASTIGWQRDSAG
jgi:hypothetical protein